MKMINQGWECPKCGRVYAPWIAQCTMCNNKSTHSWSKTYIIRNPYDFNSEGSKTNEVSEDTMRVYGKTGECFIDEIFSESEE